MTTSTRRRQRPVVTRYIGIGICDDRDNITPGAVAIDMDAPTPVMDQVRAEVGNPGNGAVAVLVSYARETLAAAIADAEANQFDRYLLLDDAP